MRFARNSRKDRVRRIPLTAQPRGVSGFRIDGLVDGSVVWAEWDGVSVALSEALYERALLAVAIDEIFDGHAVEPASLPSTLSGAPVELAVTMARSCDVLAAISYTFRGRTHTILAEPA